MEGGRMAQRSKQEYLGLMWQRYQRAGRAERTALLDEVTRMCGYHRKYAMGLLNRRQPPRPRPRRVPRRQPTYAADCQPAGTRRDPAESSSAGRPSTRCPLARLDLQSTGAPVAGRLGRKFGTHN